jgi:hypothetical protein
MKLHHQSRIDQMTGYPRIHGQCLLVTQAPSPTVALLTLEQVLTMAAEQTAFYAEIAHLQDPFRTNYTQ